MCPEMTFEFSENSLSALSSQDYCFCMRTSNENVLAGSAKVLLKNQKKFWLLSNINIEEHYQRQGCGTRLLNYLRDHLWRKNSIPIRVHPSGAGSDWLREWYLARGFDEEFPNSAYLVCVPPNNRHLVNLSLNGSGL